MTPEYYGDLGYSVACNIITVQAFGEFEIPSFKTGSLSAFSSFNEVKKFMQGASITKNEYNALIDEAVIFAKGLKASESGGEAMVLLFKSEVIAQGTAKEVSATIKSLKGLKGTKLVESLENLTSVGRRELFSKVRGLPIQKSLLSQLQKEFQKVGGVLKYDDESFAYIAAREKAESIKIEAVTLNAETILLSRTASKSAVYEELIHANQFRNGQYNNCAKSYGNEIASNLMEKEAAEELIKNSRKWGLPKSEIEIVKERLYWFKQELKHLGYHE